MKYQRKLEEEHNKPFLDLSLHQTMYKLIVENDHKHLEQLRKDFKVPDRRFVCSLQATYLHNSFSDSPTGFD